MIALQDWMTSPAAQALAWALIHFLWQGAAIALLLAVALPLCRESRTRYLLACAAMVCMVLVFGITLAAWWPADLTAARFALAHRGAIHLPPIPEGADGFITMPAGAGPPRWFVPAWLGGVSLFYLYSLVAWFAATRMKARGTFPAPFEWQQRLDRLSSSLGLRRTVRLLESCLIEVPVVIGYFRPVILLPLGLLSGLSAPQVEAILIHELAHIRRYDYLVNVLQTLVEGLLFYHPAVWWLGSVMRSEREHCCDDVVVAVQGDAPGYAATLAHLELSRGAGREPALAATGGNLMKRIHRLMQQPEGPRVAAPLLSAAVLLATATLALAAWEAPASRPPQTQPAPSPQVRQPAAPFERWLKDDVANILAGQQHSALLAQQTESQRVTAREQRTQERARDGVSPYTKWLREDVAYIITDEERTAFKKLESDNEREQFIEQFWLRRDPTPGTVANEMKEEHYRRIAYANEHYSSSIPGWKTDRGRIYITYGPPDEIDDHSSGGAYTEPDGKTISTYPFQQWRYRYIENVGTNVIIEFVDPTRSGEFHMTMDPQEKDAVLGDQRSLPMSIQFAPATLGSPSRQVTFQVPLNGQAQRYRVTGQVLAVNRIPIASFEEEVNGLNAFYLHTVSLLPGSYRVVITLKDLATGTSRTAQNLIQVQ